MADKRLQSTNAYKECQNRLLQEEINVKKSIIKSTEKAIRKQKQNLQAETRCLLDDDAFQR